MDLGPGSDRDVRSLWRSVRSAARRRGADEDTADDIAQEAWLRSLEHGSIAHPDRWMHVVALRLMGELRRARRNRRQRERVVARSERVDTFQTAEDSLHK